MSSADDKRETPHEAKGPPGVDVSFETKVMGALWRQEQQLNAMHDKLRSIQLLLEIPEDYQ